jgi:hypothetical protein
MHGDILTLTDPQAALDSIGGQFFGDQLSLQSTAVSAAAVPHPFDRLLVHNDHMTTALEKFHGVRTRLEVLETIHHGEGYSRKILLTAGDTGHVIEVGVARINLKYTTGEVKTEILKREAPLGDILIRHEVMRRIEPKWFFRFDGPASLITAFDRPLSGPVYGRVGVIYCDEVPAIELLEVVAADKANT